MGKDAPSPLGTYVTIGINSMTSPATPGPDPRTSLAMLPEPRHWLPISVVIAALTLALGFTVTSLRDVAAAEFGVDQAISGYHSVFLDVIALAIVQIFGRWVASSCWPGSACSCSWSGRARSMRSLSVPSPPPAG
ncbi:hypothetical protein Pure05_35740 [Paenarthrobacter ureafaciens]|nr:hypothetical protein Pure01_36470 [Paenarthrobacter ureafaciens]GLU65403.1 hypothetical protein Pure02_36530 [Paenarthrobacter ureafaciens]GLU69790.1 hypothetical protein Pure03_37660 [Paenarthrobacter ureafaciens]GLU73893.1 hypothetical protein Pure04_36080 [Paenarthrobacter ureafaciens]GLU78134.1 hypothetical protein Pure05_35740 [Paenarthrobacter ureafaciens]